MLPRVASCMLYGAIVSSSLLSASSGKAADLVSVNTFEKQENGAAGTSAVTNNGRYIFFGSAATNLTTAKIPRDFSTEQVYVRDTVLGKTNLSFLTSTGKAPNGGVYLQDVSRDGRYILAHALATNLVPGDTNNQIDVFIRDRVAKTTTRINVGPGGSQAIGEGSGASRGGISANGQLAVFESGARNLVAGDTNGQNDIFLYRAATRSVARASVSATGVQGNGDTFFGSIASNGCCVAFTSLASNLVPGDTNGQFDTFVKILSTGEVKRVSISSTGGQGNGRSKGWPLLSADGRFVVFRSDATNLVPNDTNGVGDVFMRDTSLNRTTRISVDSSGVQASEGSSDVDSISDDGRYVLFTTIATHVPEDTNGVTDVYLRDTVANTTVRVSVGDGNVQGNDESHGGRISPDGSVITFTTSASNFGDDTHPEFTDVYARLR